MKNDELEELRKYYNKLMESDNRKDEIKKKLAQLQSDPKVIEYIDLKRELDYFNTHDIIPVNNKKIIERIVDNISVTNTTNIYVYMSTYTTNYYNSNAKTSDTKEVLYDSEDASYRSYYNIENPSLSSIDVPINDCSEFENNNIVLFPPKDASFFDYYKKIRNIYFETAIKNGNEKAVEKVKSIKEKVKLQ